jgi:hypothetical protein
MDRRRAGGAATWHRRPVDLAAWPTSSCTTVRRWRPCGRSSARRAWMPNGQAPADQGRVLRRNGGWSWQPVVPRADPPDASPGRARDREQQCAMRPPTSEVLMASARAGDRCSCGASRREVVREADAVPGSPRTRRRPATGRGRPGATPRPPPSRVVGVPISVSSNTTKQFQNPCAQAAENSRPQLHATGGSWGRNGPRRGRDPAPGRVRPMLSPGGNYHSARQTPASRSFLLGRRYRPAGTARGWLAACGG